MTDGEKMALATLVFGGFIAFSASKPRPLLTMQDYGYSPLPTGWPEILRASRFNALSVKIGYGSTIKTAPSVAEKLGLASQAGLERHGSWWVVSRTHADAERDGKLMAEACNRYGCTAFHLNAEKSFFGNREKDSGGPCPDVPGRMRILIGQLRALAPSLKLYWNGYHGKTFTNAAGETQTGVSAAEMQLVDVFEPMIYLWDYTAKATSKSAHEKQADRWRRLRKKFPGLAFSPMVFQGNWNGKAWLGTNRAAAGFPGLAGLVAELRPEGVSFWRWASSKDYGDQLVQDTAAAPQMRVLGPQLHDAYRQGVSYVA